MVNPGRGDVTLQVQPGVEVTLRFTCGALASLQTALGLPWSAEGFAALFKRISSPRIGDEAHIVVCGVHSIGGDPVAATSVLVTLPPRERLEFYGRAVIAAFPLPDPHASEEPSAPFDWDTFCASALRWGMTEAEFWASTPRQVSRFILGAQDRHDQALDLARLTGVFARAMAKRLPDLGPMYMGTRRKKRAKKPVDPDLAVMLMALAWGSTLRDEHGNELTPDQIAAHMAAKKQELN